MDNRPVGRKKNVGEGGSGVHKRGEGLGTGPVGNSSGYSSGPSSSGGGGSQRASGGGRSPLFMIIIVLVLLLGGGGGISSLFGGGGGLGGGNVSNQGSGTTVTQTQTAMPQTGSGMSMLGSLLGSYGSYTGSSSGANAAWSAESNTGRLDTSVSSKARAKRTTILGNGQDVVTIMVYMCGADLESRSGMASRDLQEMLAANLGDNINLIVYTGGAKQWQNNVVSSSTNQIYQIKNGKMNLLQDNLGSVAMTKPDTLTGFIKYAASTFPANRNVLIFWDHGGGSLTGYGYDQNFNGSMTLDKINRALYDGGVKFDFIGFDACLMATLENAVVIDQYADYLIASEETEPGCGWYYTKWLTELSKNTSINTVTLAKTIIDDFNDVCKKNNAGDSTTLSIVDLAEFHSTVPRAFGDFATSVSGLLDTKKYDVVANARRSAREFGASAGINHVDLIHLANGVGTSEAQSLIKALQGCIKYNRTSKSMTNAYGMSIYFPYTSFSSVNSAVSLYNAIGVDPQYSACIKSFASLAAGGQIATGSTSSPLGSLFGDFSGTTSSSSSSDVLGGLLGSFLGGGSSGGSGDIAGSLIGSILGGRSMGDNDWFDAQKVLDNADYYDAHAIYADDMMTTVKGDKTVLSLSKEKWEMVQNVQLNVFVDDGEGYIDLGMDNVYEFDSDGDLLIDYDRTWIALDGQIVPYYMISNVTDGDDYVITGRVPAYLNGDHDHLVYVIIVFDNETEDNEYGYVAGVRYNYKDETDTLGRGLIALKEGDKLEFVCDFYGYDKTYQASYFFGDPLTIGKQMPEVTNVPIPDDLTALISYCLTDIYDNEFWTMSKKF